MNPTRIALALALAVASAASHAQAPKAAAPTPAETAALFAEHKQKLLELRSRTDACIRAATEGRAAMACLATERAAQQGGKAPEASRKVQAVTAAPAQAPSR
jgi:hypothetical protein